MWESWSVDTGEKTGVSGEVMGVNTFCSSHYHALLQHINTRRKENVITSELHFGSH